MKRRTFLSLSVIAFVPAPLVLSCVRQNEDEAENELNSLQDTLFEHYNNGEQDAALHFYDSDCTYRADGISRDSDKLGDTLEILYRYQKKQGLLPLKIKDRKTRVYSDISWIVCELTTQSEKHVHGFLTQILKRNGSTWKIVHHHFSSAG